MEIPMRRFIAVLLFAAAPALGQDAVQTDREKYRAILENECVRVLEYNDRPGERTHPHRHPAPPGRWRMQGRYPSWSPPFRGVTGN